MGKGARRNRGKDVRGVYQLGRCKGKATRKGGGKQQQSRREKPRRKNTHAYNTAQKPRTEGEPHSAEESLAEIGAYRQ